VKNELATLVREDLSEPSGVAPLNGTDKDLMIADDTNNHRLARVSPDGEVRTFEI
jgi:hypothetical protein